jgi:arylsulfatase A-like enzyme
VGKWHIGVPTLGGPNNPLMQGFAWAAASEGSVQDYFSWPKHVNGKYVGSDVYSTVDLTDAAIARANQMRSPWLLWLAYHAPHMPFHIPPRDLQERDLRPGDVIGMHAAMVEAMDHEIGRLLASIDPAVLARTTIVFIGDNGTDSAAVPSEIHERAKGSLFEGGIHVPLIVSGAAVTPRARGRTCERLVQALDLFATIAELAKVSPANSMPPDHPLDSASFLPLLSDPDGPSPRRYVYVEKFKPNGPGPYSEYDQTILDDRWKLLRQHDWTRGRYTDLFFDRGRTTPGHEGEDLCPCPEKLTGESRAAYERLAKQMAEIRNP